MHFGSARSLGFCGHEYERISVSKRRNQPLKALISATICNGSGVIDRGTDSARAFAMGVNSLTTFDAASLAQLSDRPPSLLLACTHRTFHPTDKRFDNLTPPRLGQCVRNATIEPLAYASSPWQGAPRGFNDRAGRSYTRKVRYEVFRHRRIPWRSQQGPYR